MIVFPNAKINLGLNIVERRPDGYHNLETVFYPISLADILEVTPRSGQGEARLHLSGLVPEGAAEDNLVVRAYRLLEKKRSLPSVDIYLHKVIPSGAGMGGGSSDATAMLQLLNSLFALGLTEEELTEDARTLGADCPFFLKNCPAFAQNTGDLLEKVPVLLSDFRMAIVKPPIFVSTAAAFRSVTPRRSEIPVRQAVLDYPVSKWREVLHNDFEGSLFPQFPQLARVKSKLYESGALYASMTGSGSAFFALYPLSETTGAAEAPLLRTRLAELFPDSFVWTDESLH